MHDAATDCMLARYDARPIANPRLTPSGRACFLVRMPAEKSSPKSTTSALSLDATVELLAADDVSASLAGNVVTIRYATLAVYNARVSADVEAVRAAEGVKILRSEVAHPVQAAAPGPHVVSVVCG